MNAFVVMLCRIPLNAYFSRFGDIGNRGKEFSYGIIAQNLAAIIAVVFLGKLIDKTGLHIFLVIQTITIIIAALILWGSDGDDMKIAIPTEVKKEDVPLRVRRAYLYSRLPYAFNKDMLVIWITILMGKFVLTGIYFAITIVSQMIVSYLAGYFSDKGTIKKVFYVAVALTAFLWLFIPFVRFSFDVFLLQFILGVSNLVVETPVEREYYNLAKLSGNDLGFSWVREWSIQSGIVLGCLLTLVLVFFVKQWQYLLLLGAFYPLALTLIFNR
jgi:MFS family permease